MRQAMGDLTDWNEIAGHGANAPLSHFGNPQHEFDALRSGTIVSPVTNFALLRFHGSDSASFLQGQLTCDLNQVTADKARFGGYCTPKGRLLADFLLLQTPLGYLMHVPADVSAGLADRLRKFVLRSDVKIERDSGLRAFGVAGPGAAALLQKTLGTPPSMPLAVVRQSSATIVQVPGRGFLVLAVAADVSALWETLARESTPAGADCWSAFQVRGGVPWITAKTQDQFLPQMIGLERLGGISFEKGCYAGQEIVARAHYLGEVKRKLQFGRVRGFVQAGDPLMSAGGQCGTVLNAAPIPGDETELLAVVSFGPSGDDQIEVRSATGERVNLSAPANALASG
jgi:folate-binding protein YgfZ